MKRKKSRTLDASVAVFLCTIVICANSSRSEEPPQSVSALVQDVLSDPVAHRRNTEELRSRANAKVVLNVLMSAAENTPPKTRVVLLDIIADLGAPLRDRQAAATPHDNLVDDEGVIDFMVARLSDTDAEVQERAASILTARVEGRGIVRKSDAIIPNVSARTNELPAILLGMTRAPSARELLTKTRQGKSLDSHQTKLALAMLGDTNCTEAIMPQYHAEKDPDKKASLSKDLAYIGSCKAILALASDLRCPLVVRWGGEGRRSFRLVVIEALSRLYPTETLLWKPRVAPTSDKYYEQIEKWAEETFHVQWTRTRPAFLYEEYGLMGGAEVWRKRFQLQQEPKGEQDSR